MKVRNEAIVGLVVILSIITAIVGAVWLSGRSWGTPQREVMAAFAEVGTLSEGNPVKYRGVGVGRVTGIELSPQGTGVYVSMALDSDIRLPPDAAVILSPESLFGDWQAEIVPMQQYPDLVFIDAPRAEVLPGATLPDISELTAVAARIAGDIELLSDRIQIAFTPETAVKIRQTIENVEGVTEQLSGFVDQQTRTYAEVGSNVLAATENIRQTTVSAEETLTEVRESLRSGEVQQILANARLASENLAQLSTELRGAASGVPALVASADTTFASFRATAGRLNQTLDALQPGLAAVGPTMDEVQQLIVRFNGLLTNVQQSEGTLGRLIADPALYEEFQRLVVTMQRLMADIQANPGKYIREVQVF